MRLELESAPRHTKIHPEIITDNYKCIIFAEISHCGMRRVISIFLLFVMATVGVRPVFVMHYCGNKLYAAGLIKHEISKPCCASAVVDRSLQSDYPLIKSPACCHIQRLQISTDDYSHQTQPLNVIHTLPAFDSVWITLNYLLDELKCDKAFITQRLFPPGEGISKQNIDLLTFICVFRI
jgi:hypothetical protein